MRRSASEIIRNLESRIARLERQSSKTVRLKEGDRFMILKRTMGSNDNLNDPTQIRPLTFDFLPGTILKVREIDIDSRRRNMYFDIDVLVAGPKNQVKDSVNPWNATMWVNGKGGGEYVLDGTVGYNGSLAVYPSRN